MMQDFRKTLETFRPSGQHSQEYRQEQANTGQVHLAFRRICASVQKSLLNKEQMICIVLALQAREDVKTTSIRLQFFIAYLLAVCRVRTTHTPIARVISAFLTAVCASAGGTQSVPGVLGAPDEHGHCEQCQGTQQCSKWGLTEHGCLVIHLSTPQEGMHMLFVFCM